MNLLCTIKTIFAPYADALNAHPDVSSFTNGGECTLKMVYGKNGGICRRTKHVNIYVVSVALLYYIADFRLCYLVLPFALFH